MTRIRVTLNQLVRRGTANPSGPAGSPITFRNGVYGLILLLALESAFTGSAVAQTRGGALTLRYTAISPIIALLAGILILIRPRLLNFIVAIYLILIGLIGILGV